MSATRHLADLHRHLDGSLRPDTIQELAKAQSKYLPHRLPFSRGMGLAEALSRFKFVLDLIQRPADVQRVAAEACEDAIADGVTTLELRFAPQLHRGGSLEEIADAALAGVDGRAGLIFCGLFGEPPSVLESLVEVAASRPGVVGIDLAGGPEPNHRWIMEDYRKAFLRAAELGLGRTVHAGEGRPPDEIALAIDVLGAQRIGHAVTILEDREVVELVGSRGIVIESCPTSNIHTGVVLSLEDHPLPRMLEAGLEVCVNTDNTFFSDTTASRELAQVASLRRISEEQVERMLITGHAAAFKRG
jgi:adenosine deaminase